MDPLTHDIFADLLERIHQACHRLVTAGRLPRQVDVSRISLDPPREAAHGDMATNAAMVLAKEAGLRPRELAEAIASQLRDDPRILQADIAGPGFINITLRPQTWIDVLRSGLRLGPRCGRSEVAAERVNVEYVSANPTGPLHVGHCRGAVSGDALANVLAFVGHHVTREFYVNDAGAQVDVLARSA